MVLQQQIFYRSLMQKFATADTELDMTLVHADASTLMKNLMRDNKDAQAEIHEGLTQRPKQAGTDCIAIPSFTDQLCIKTLK
jgi:hypothetical protein